VCVNFRRVLQVDAQTRFRESIVEFSQMFRSIESRDACGFNDGGGIDSGWVEDAIMSGSL